MTQIEYVVLMLVVACTVAPLAGAAAGRLCWTKGWSSWGAEFVRGFVVVMMAAYGAVEFGWWG